MPRPPIRLDSGSPFFATPTHIVEAAKHALDEGYTDYIMEKGDPLLVAAISESITKEAGAPYSPSQILITNGASSGLYAVMAALLQPGDEVIVFDPSYFVFPAIVRQLRAIVMPVKLNAEYQLDLEAVRRAITPKTRLVLLNNPNNPTGCVFEREALEQLCEVCAERGVLIVSDEAYALIVRDQFTHVPILSFQRYRDVLILLGSFSKAYAMTGWRLGYLVAPVHLIDTIYRVHRTITGPICSFVQRAGVAALTGDHSWIADINRQYEQRAMLAYRRASSIAMLHPARPQGAFYLWCRYDFPMPTSELCAWLANKGVIVRSGTDYGAAGEQHFRISYAADLLVIDEGFSVIREALVNR